MNREESRSGLAERSREMLVFTFGTFPLGSVFLRKQNLYRVETLGGYLRYILATERYREMRN